jgi:hypothetical protein
MESNNRFSRRTNAAIGCLALICVLTACSSHPAAQPSSPPAQPAPATASLKTVAELDPTGKTPDQLAAYVFEKHGCKTCHTLGTGGKLGFTERGKQVGQNFEGCISLLTSMNVIAQVKEENRTAEEKRKAARFEEFGCTTCHQITPGKLGLTAYGVKLRSMHLACTDVQRILSKN